MTDAITLSWLQLYRSENVGPITFGNLLQRFGSAEEVLKAIPDLVARVGGKRAPKICPREIAEKEIEALDKFGGKFLCAYDQAYPEILRHIADPPPVLSYMGHLSLLQRQSVAIVGSRSASQNAKRFTAYMAREIGDAGYVVTSGLARGIDATAHEAALDTGTIAVIAGGIDTIYPFENTKLQLSIQERGLLFAEAPFGAKPIARAFPKRNRIIAGLSRGTLVVEAALKSGTLITARLANEYGREVFAVPGFPTDPKGAGCNMLIKNGAQLVESPQDLLEALEIAGFALGEPQQDLFGFSEDVATAPLKIDEQEVAQARDEIKNLVGAASIPVDELLSECHFSAQIAQAALSELELAGAIERLPGNRIAQVLAFPTS